MINILELQPDDNERYRKLWVSGITEHPEFFRIALKDDPNPKIPTKFNPYSFTLGAFSEDNLVGVVSFERDARFKLLHKALIFRMFVHPTAAGQDIGKALLQRVLLMAKKLPELRYLYLTVLASNERAIALYSSLNFKEFAREIGGVNINGCFIDELQMAHQLVNT
jgi:cyclohexyl-isocyanide hydratase